ncbi:uncharacterized protein LY89DRAFT_701518 [Mollisia scopiformis]|uniref:Uncharacterized protein n=1 Tax=Mollisia scopiformis TaxID=149040 RepID=A0A132B9A0_MOLSC|nr:uncharacterized protein LY89DRAFT_701518 [Mollisia scopiformis]KUJ08980.1 hypothetical protein LY89DRAFT_701518 [Mollisia scopiformis]
MSGPKDQLVIAIDFGTTFSGIAYAFRKDAKPDVMSIMDWPGLEGFQQPKVPTILSYDAINKSSFTWGAQKHKNDILRGVKLLLDLDQPRPTYLAESVAKADLQELGKSAVDVAADYLGAMYKHAMTVISSKMPIEYLALCDQQFVLSVPAVWSDKAKNLTLRVGDAFVICDAGGGTADLISYEIARLLPRLELKELVPGTGGMAGSLGLNRRFEQTVKDLVGEVEYLRLRKTVGFEQAVDQFDKTRIFDPLIEDIQRLVKDQVRLVRMKQVSNVGTKPIKAIFLVGGFGSSAYLKASLEADHPDIQVIQPHGAWAAINTTNFARTWYINSGQDLKRDQTIRFPFYRSLAEGYHNYQLIFYDDLIQSEDEDAPVHPSAAATRTNCTLTADLRAVPLNTFTRNVGTDGITYHQVHYHLVIKIESAVMKVSLEINGQEMGTVDAKYE